jgi:hypothetical protein|uniref:Uncharacterized protein n=1 Tax=Siphoviridae sp. ctuvi3 TaxID=2825718 RepID=A0A8S5TZM9_9CAUD|nr:MAG TPA: hypothetical protein [Siphoviridae sp. ctuvi3]
MAKTKNSVRGKQNKKIVPVKSYKRCDGTIVRAHRRSTPN